MAKSGRIWSIRVQDIAKQKWFNWDRGNWDAAGTPVVTPGVNNLYIVFGIMVEPVYPIASEYMTLEIIEVATGTVLASKSVWVSSGATEQTGLEWTGNMPHSPYSITLLVTP